MYKNREIWVGLFEDASSSRSCKEFWVDKVQASETSYWTTIERALPEGNTLIAIFPGRIPTGMRWSPVDRRARTEQQQVDVWDSLSFED